MDLPDLYRDIVESSPDGIWVIDLDGRTIYANPAFWRLYGADPDDVDDLTVFDTLDATGKVQFAEHLRLVRLGRPEADEVEVHFIALDGTPTWILLRETVLHAPDGSVDGILHRIVDFGERRREREEQRATSDRLREAQEIARLGSWDWDLTSGIVSAPPIATDRAGDVVAPLRLLSTVTYPDFLSVLHPDDREETHRRVAEAIQGGYTFEFDARIPGPGGVSAWVRVRGVVRRGADGTATSVTGTYQDVTAIKAIELALRDEIRQAALMRSMASAANESASFRDVLLRARELVMQHDDWRSARAFVPVEGDLELIQDRRDDLDATVLAAELDLARRAWESRESVWSDDGFSIAFLVGVDDQVCAIVTLTADAPLVRHAMVQSMVESVGVQLGRVAEREQAEHELADARDAAMAASRQKSEFLATMSHEIRTPLNGIIGLNALLLRTPLDGAQQQLATGVRTAGQSLLGVINDVLDFSKGEAGRLEVEQVDFEVRPLLDQLVGMAGEAARAAGIDLLVGCDTDVPPILTGDPTRLAQVLRNLVSNGVKFTHEGRVEVGASWSGQGDPGGDGALLQVRVRDTGVGITAEHVTRLFEPFTQADASTTRRYGGTGLGLAISAEIAGALGGELTYEPCPDGGSLFIFTLPLGVPAAHHDPMDTHARKHLEHRRLLVVGDDPHRLSHLVAQLGWWQVRVDGVTEPGAAMTALKASLVDEDPYEAVLLDLSEPAGDGFSLAGRIAAETAYDAVTLVVFSSVPDVDDERVREAGISAYLVKPVTSALVRSTLLDLLAGVAPEPRLVVDAPRQRTEERRILVVEDNPVNQIVATGLLESMGYLVEVSEDGLRALEAVAARPQGYFAAVLMDVQMPGLDGYATTRALRERETADHRLPVIAMTASAVKGERERCLDAGMDDFLTKPVDPVSLSGTLDLWLGQHDAAPLPGVRDPAALPPTPAITGLDTQRLDMLRDLDPGDTAYLDRAIGNFQVNSAAAVEAIFDHVAAGDAKALKAAAHKIAGSALNLGAPRAGEAARALELVGDTGSVVGADALMPELEHAMAEARALLLTYQATYTD